MGIRLYNIDIEERFSCIAFTNATLLFYGKVVRWVDQTHCGKYFYEQDYLSRF